MSDITNISEQREFTITRVVDAPVARVFAGWTDPDLVSRWFAPDGWSAPREQITMDVRVGGSCRLTMVEGTGAEHPAVFTYREVDAPRSLAFTTAAPDADHDAPGTPVATLTLTDLGDRTDLRFVASAPEAQAGDVEIGWRMMIDRLAGLVSAG
jgi:uncharacterized protein YndB with AHSA1/START domain